MSRNVDLKRGTIIFKDNKRREGIYVRTYALSNGLLVTFWPLETTVSGFISKSGFKLLRASIPLT